MSGSITRRGVLSGAAALAGVTSLPQFLMAADIGHVVVDERLAHSAAFASGFHAPRIHRVSALDDLCNRWYTGMRKAVLADVRHIAGLTSWMDYVVMHGCAAEIGYGSTFHSEHLAPPDSSRSWAKNLGQVLASGAHLPSHSMSGAVPGHVRMVTWVFAPRSV